MMGDQLTSLEAPPFTFRQNELRANTLVTALLSEEREYRSATSKAEGVIQKLVADIHHPILEGKSPQEMWRILEERFQHISPMSVTRSLYEASNLKMSDCKGVIEFTSSYQTAFDKIASLLKAESNLTLKGTEMLLQGTMLMNIGEEYSSLVSAIETAWTDKTTNLSDTILRIIRHSEIMKGNAKDRVLVTGIHRAPKGTCTNQECIDKGLTTHYTDRCWVKHPELRAKYTLRQMRPKGSNRNLKGAAACTDTATEATIERTS